MDLHKIFLSAIEHYVIFFSGQMANDTGAHCIQSKGQANDDLPHSCDSHINTPQKKKVNIGTGLYGALPWRPTQLPCPGQNA